MENVKVCKSVNESDNVLNLHIIKDEFFGCFENKMWRKEKIILFFVISMGM